jgi:hypothetical protein
MGEEVENGTHTMDRLDTPCHICVIWVKRLDYGNYAKLVGKRKTFHRFACHSTDFVYITCHYQRFCTAVL